MGWAARSESAKRSFIPSTPSDPPLSNPRVYNKLEAAQTGAMAQTIRIPVKVIAAGRRPAYNIWHMLNTADTLADAQSCVDALRDFYTSIAAFYNSTTSISMGENVVEVGTTPPVVYATLVRSLVGTGGTAQAPYQLANVCSLRTGFAGRSYRGRIYLGPMSDTALNGAVLNGALVTTINTALATLIAAEDVRVYSEKVPVSTPVTSATNNGNVETQRRRARN